MPRVLSGIQPTADSFHLGNYLGPCATGWPCRTPTSVSTWWSTCAITVPVDPETLRARTRSSYAQLVAAGIDPQRGDCLRPGPGAGTRRTRLGHAVPDRVRRGVPHDAVQDKASRQGTDTASVGLFTYPILQAADILVYPRGRGAGGRGPTPAPGAHARPGAAAAAGSGTPHRPRPFIGVKDTARVVDLQDPTSKMSRSPYRLDVSSCSMTPRRSKKLNARSRTRWAR